MITRYEVTATNGTRTVLVGYTPRISRPGLLAVMQRQGDRLIATCGISDIDPIEFIVASNCHPRIHAHVGKHWIVGFTGRTQREAIQGREHDFIAETA